MSERISPTPEQHKGPEHQTEVEQSPEQHKHSKEKEHKNSPEKTKSDIEHIKKSIESNAISGKEYSVAEKETAPDQQYGNTKALKKTAYRKVIKKAQSQLKGPEKTFSKIIHRPSIEKASDVASKTVARPTGLLVGSIFAFIASLVVFYISKRSGFTYNYLLFILVFISGYFLGLLVETIMWFIRKPRKR